MKKRVCIYLILLISFILYGCSGKKVSEEAVPYEVVNGDIIMSGMKLFSRHGDFLILAGIGEDTEKVTAYGGHPQIAKMYTFDLEGNLIKEGVLEGARFQYADIDSDGKIWTIASFTSIDEMTGEFTPPNTIIKCYDMDGKFLEELDMGQLGFNIGEFPGSQFLVGEDGKFYYLRGTDETRPIYILSSDGTPPVEISTSSYAQVKSIAKLPDSRVAVILGTSDGSNVLREIDTTIGELGVEWDTDIKDQYMHATTDTDGEFELLLTSDQGVYGYSLEKEEATRLIDWGERGVKNIFDDMFRYVVYLPDQSMFSLLRDDVDVRYSFDSPQLKNINFWLIRMEPAEEGQTFGQPETSNVTAAASDKKKVSLYALILNDDMREAVAAFNHRNEEYQVEVKTYAEGGITREDAIDNLLIDILSGNIPDILLIDNSMDVDSLISKGILADLYEFMDTDPSISREDYLPNILSALETEGKLYTGITSFSILTLMGKATDVGEDMGWTWEDYHTLLSEKPVGTIPIDDFYLRLSKQEFIGAMLMTKLDEFVDDTTGECSFENQEFAAFLEMAESYPREQGGRIPIDAFRSGESLLMSVSVASFNSGKMMEVTYFGEPTTFIGYPTDSGGIGTTASEKNQFAITENAEEKEGAWEFARYLLTDFQEIAGKEGFPISKEQLNRLAEEAMENPKNRAVREFYLWDEDHTYTVEVDNNTEEDNQKIYELIAGTTSFAGNKDWISQIVLEEVEYYFAGHKSAMEVGAIIENRVSLYLAE